MQVYLRVFLAVPSNSETVLFSIGDFRSRYRAQMENSIFGKVLKFNKKNKNYEVISMGHRNPQGLFYNEKENFFLKQNMDPKVEMKLM